MDDLIDLIFSALSNRLTIFVLGVVLTIGGIYGWIDYRREAKMFDAAVSKSGRSVAAEVIYKGTDTEPADAQNFDYFDVQFVTEDGPKTAKVYVNQAEFGKYKISDKIDLKFHAEHPEYIVTPQTERPSTLMATAVSGICIGLGVLLCLAVIISLF